MTPMIEEKNILSQDDSNALMNEVHGDS